MPTDTVWMTMQEIADMYNKVHPRSPDLIISITA